MTEYKEILRAIENLLIERKDKLTHLWELNNSYFREIEELKKENKQLRDDLCELSREFTKKNKI
jgi:predicted RNase H-like nuclease (RuvC/YqgF family)